MILLSILLWRSKRKNRIFKKQANAFAKTELDAEESQRPNRTVRELPGDMAHELGGEENDNEVWELPGDMTYELRGGENEIDRPELPGDMAYELEDHR